MKKRSGIFHFILVTGALVVTRAVFAVDQSAIANALDWTPTKTCDKNSNLCDGYYAQPTIVSNTPKPLPAKKVPVNVTSTGPVIFRQNGVSELQDNVVLTQPGRLIHADKAFIYEDSKTGKITHIKLVGHVRAAENDKLMVGTEADYNVIDKTLTINNGIYRIAGEHDELTLKTPLNAFGTAQEIKRADKITYITKGTYSTCSPVNPTWQLYANSMELNSNTEEGKAHDVTLKFKNVPIFYSPYLSFPLKRQRKTGFLSPLINSSTTSGFMFGEPFYLNLAPNYDLLLTPAWYTERGLQVTEDFRYLTSNSDGFLYSNLLTNDTKFGTFRQQTLASYANTPYSPTLQPYLNELQNDNDQRAFFNYEDHTEFNQNWSAKVYLRYMTDSYYNEDFQSQYMSQNTNQLPSFGELDYNGVHWQDSLVIQAYQTLFPIDQINTAAQEQYTRLPEWDFSAAYPEIANHLDFNVSGQAVNFDYNSDYTPFTYQMPIGERLHFDPSFSTPFDYASFYFTPQLTADNTDYFAQLATATSGVSRPEDNAARTLPILDVDTGWYFDHDISIGKGNYIQTLEPRIFYLYVPYEDQDSYPNFDTVLLPFSTANLYALNEFSGFDRLQNANQVTLGVTSNLMRSSDASTVLSSTIGVIDYFESQKVCLQPGCAPDTNAVSPITGSVTWTPTSPWSITTTIAWDPVGDQLNNAQLGTTYHLLDNKIVTFNYQFVQGQVNTPFYSFGNNTDSSLITFGLIWPLSRNWNGFGYTYYDLSNSHAINQYIGLSYDTCCWAFRVIGAEDYIGPNQVAGGQVAQNTFNNAVYVQLSLKGLGTAGYHNPESTLESTLPGFIDPMANKGDTKYEPID